MKKVKKKTLNENRCCRCCNRKPLSFKVRKLLFCPKCNVAYDIKTGVQITNWAYSEIDDEHFISLYN